MCGLFMSPVREVTAIRMFVTGSDRHTLNDVVVLALQWFSRSGSRIPGRHRHHLQRPRGFHSCSIVVGGCSDSCRISVIARRSCCPAAVKNIGGP